MSASASAVSAWVLFVLNSIGADRPKAVRADYASIADVYAQEALDAPLFPGDDGVWRTAALEVAVSQMESGFDKTVVNHEGGDQIGLFQVHEINLKYLGLTSKDELLDIRVNTHAAMALMRRSFAFCVARKREESWWLGPYASGRESCDYGITASKERMGRGAWVFTHFALLDEQ